MTESPGLPGKVEQDPGSPRPDRFRLLSHQLASTVLDLLFPPRCLNCKRVGSLLCQSCLSKIPTVAPIHERGSPLAERRATAEFADVIQTAIHELKYNGKRDFAPILGQRLADELKRSGWQPTLITAAPLHAARYKQRGYNQAAMLADHLARQANLPFSADALHRTRDTRPQVGLGRKDRQENMVGAFAANPTIVKDQAVVIVDDVYTTGATLRACASALLEAGASKVWALTVASAGRTEIQAMSQ